MTASGGDLLYLIDTNHAYLLLPEPRQVSLRFQEAIRQAQIALCVPSVAELWFMVLNSARQAENRRDLDRLLNAHPVLPFDLPAAHEFGQMPVELRRAGRQIPQIDCQIAAIARSRRLVVVSADRHFNAVESLSRENWLQ